MFYQVSIQTRTNGDVGEAMFTFEHIAPSLAELFILLTGDGFLLGRRYETRAEGAAARRVRRSNDCILSRDVILQVSPLPDTLRDADGTVLYVPGAAYV